MHGKRYVFKHGLARDETEILKNDSELSTVIGDLAGLHRIEVLPVDHDLAGGRHLFAHDHFQKRTFARAGSADNEYKLTGVDMQIYVDKRLYVFPVCFGDVIKIYHTIILFLR